MNVPTKCILATALFQWECLYLDTGINSHPAPTITTSTATTMMFHLCSGQEETEWYSHFIDSKQYWWMHTGAPICYIYIGTLIDFCLNLLGCTHWFWVLVLTEFSLSHQYCLQFCDFKGGKYRCRFTAIWIQSLWIYGENGQHSICVLCDQCFLSKALMTSNL